jgi:hypothetical protein
VVGSQFQQIVPWDLVWKTPITKRAGRVAQGVGPEFKPQYHKKINKKRIPLNRPLSPDRNMATL